MEVSCQDPFKRPLNEKKILQGDSTSFITLDLQTLVKGTQMLGTGIGTTKKCWY
jgi:hypothetical protein